MLAIFTCRIDRRKQRGMKNWEEKHVAHVNAWNLRANNIVFGGPVHHDSQFKIYLEWLKQQTRLNLKVAMDATNIEDLPSDPEDVFDEYDAHTRMGRQPERGPFEDYIVSYNLHYLNTTNRAIDCDLCVYDLCTYRVIKLVMQTTQLTCLLPYLLWLGASWHLLPIDLGWA